MNDTDYKESLAIKAFQMFRDWTKNAQSHYPNLDFTIVDESVLVKDLTDTIRSAKASLTKEEKEAKRAIPGYDIGFMLGFIQSNLHVHWVNEYVLKQSQEYKTFIALKAIQNFLRLNELACIRIQKIYEYLMNEDINFEQINLDISPKYIEGFAFADLPQGQEPAVMQAIDNELKNYIVNFYKEKYPDLMGEIEVYFSEEEIQFLVDNESI